MCGYSVASAPKAYLTVCVLLVDGSLTGRRKATFLGAQFPGNTTMGIG
jgi:hypothetical protein